MKHVENDRLVYNVYYEGMSCTEMTVDCWTASAGMATGTMQVNVPNCAVVWRWDACGLGGEGSMLRLLNDVLGDIGFYWGRQSLLNCRSDTVHWCDMFLSVENRNVRCDVKKVIQSSPVCVRNVLGKDVTSLRETITSWWILPVDSTMYIWQISSRNDSTDCSDNIWNTACLFTPNRCCELWQLEKVFGRRCVRHAAS